MVAKNDCGNTENQAFLIKGDNYVFEPKNPISSVVATCNFGSKIIYAFDAVDVKADYQLEMQFYSDTERVQQIIVDGNIIFGPFKLEAGKEITYKIDVPRKAFAYGQLVLNIELISGPNAVISALNVYSTNTNPLKAFAGDKRLALQNSLLYKVNSNIDVEKVLPIYRPLSSRVLGVYHPVLSLDGCWKFNEKPTPDFWKQTALSSDWKDIVVPAQWNMQGFKVDSAGYGAYQTVFNLPSDWHGKQVVLRFDGVSSECTVYLNGTEIGSHMGGMTAFEFNISKYLIAGTNVLSLKVRSESLADMLGSLTQYAAHQIGGITRKVRLMALPSTHITDLRVVTDLDSLYQDAELQVFVAVKNESNIAVNNYLLQLTLENTTTRIEKLIPSIAPGASWSGWVRGIVHAPLKWDNEHPHLYNMVVNLSENKSILQQVEKRIGFKEIKIEGNEMFVNGKAVKLRGVCRHEMHPLTGRVLTPAQCYSDAQLYKNANCNFIRTSHYPPAEEFLNACDELGLFVEVEAPICWIGHGANTNWTKLNYQDSIYYDYVLQANMENIHFNRNHPSIVFWSIANESLWNKGFAQVFEYVKKADTTRPSTFHDQAYGGFNNQGSTCPISNIHYPGPNGYKMAAKSERPLIYGEYCHLNVYNRREIVTDPGVRSDWALALAPTWDMMYKTKGALGGSIWSGIDDIFQLPDGTAVGYGAWGPIDGWRRPKPEYWDMKKSYSPIRLLTKSLQPASKLSLEIENRLTFSNLNEYRLQWKIGEESGVLIANAEPTKLCRVDIPVAHPTDGSELYVSFVDAVGMVVDEYLIPVGKQAQNKFEALKSQMTKYKETNNKYIITGSDFVCEISRLNGQILSLTKKKALILNGGPLLMVLPLDGEPCLPSHNAKTPPFNDVCSEWKMSTISIQQEGDNVKVTVSGSYLQMAGKYDLIINANGEIKTNYQFTASKEVNPRQWGMVFESPATYTKTFWRRDALWTVYPNDHIGRPVGEAELFYQGIPTEIDPRIKPTWAWSQDYNDLGSADFRSTRRNIHFAGLQNANGNKVIALSDGQQHWRCWLNKEKIQFLVADFVTAGNEMFLNSYFTQQRKPLKINDEVKGCVLLRIQ